MNTWKKRPGSFDPLHLGKTFNSANGLHLPDLLPQPDDFIIPGNLKTYGFRQKIRTKRPVLIHFFRDDYRFEIIWNEPRRGINAVCRKQVFAACSPDFSLWLDMPIAMQIWNIYRSRWCSRLWQENGCIVVPTMSWSSLVSTTFSFLGIPHNQVVALRSMYRSSIEEKTNFLEGYNAMVEQVKPRHILWFGKICNEVNDDIPKTVYGTEY